MFSHQLHSFLQPLQPGLVNQPVPIGQLVKTFKIQLQIMHLLLTIVVWLQEPLSHRPRHTVPPFPYPIILSPLHYTWLSSLQASWTPKGHKTLSIAWVICVHLFWALTGVLAMALALALEGCSQTFAYGKLFWILKTNSSNNNNNNNNNNSQKTSHMRRLKSVPFSEWKSQSQKSAMHLCNFHIQSCSLTLLGTQSHSNAMARHSIKCTVSTPTTFIPFLAPNISSYAIIIKLYWTFAVSWICGCHYSTDWIGKDPQCIQSVSLSVFQ